MSATASARDDIQRLCAGAPMPAVAVAVLTNNVEMPALTCVDGIANQSTGEAATIEHMWDLASLTKVLITLPEVLSLIESGSLSLDVAMGSQWPRARSFPVGEATLRQVLSFDAGLPASAQWFRNEFSTRSELVEVVLKTPLERPPGTGAVYSDVGMIMLGEMVTDLVGQSLDVLARQRTGLRFGPVPEPVVATEYCEWRGRLIAGEVHDENAYALGGVAGHAGGFGTIDTVSEAVSGFWRATEALGSPWAAAVVQQSSNESGERFGLGWWLSNTHGLGGRGAGKLGWGATGFVGNRIWVEPERGYGVIILSNRVHPYRGDRALYDGWCSRLLSLAAQHFK